MQIENRVEHPNRSPADHANLDPRRAVKHPKVATPARRGAERPARQG